MTAPTTTTPRRPSHKMGCSRPDLACSFGPTGGRRIGCPECGRYITLARDEHSPLWRPDRPVTKPATATPPLPHLDHRPDCTAPDAIEWQGQRGDPMLTCRSCRAVRNLSGRPASRTPAPTTTPTRPPRPRASQPEPAAILDTGYRCREHQHQTVTWRGTGCPDCASERDQRFRSRKKKPATVSEEGSAAWTRI